jgi:hypothetical protein
MKSAIVFMMSFLDKITSSFFVFLFILHAQGDPVRKGGEELRPP